MPKITKTSETRFSYPFAIDGIDGW